MSTRRWDSSGPATAHQRKRVARLGPFYVDWASRLGSLHRCINDEIVALVTDENDAIAIMNVLNECAGAVVIKERRARKRRRRGRR